MEAGYDYLLVRASLQQRFIQVSGIFLFIIGAILLTAGVAYFIYAEKARSDLGRLNVSVAPPSPQTLPQQGAQAASVSSSSLGAGQGIFDPRYLFPTSPRVVAPSAQDIEVVMAEGPSSTAMSPSDDMPVEEAGIQPEAVGDGPPQISSSAIVSQQLYPGEAIKATYWSNPLEYEPASYVESSLVQGFKPVDPSQALPLGSLPSPTRIIIPFIGVDSRVEGLQIMDLGDSRAYNTPDHVVGHIPQSANPGEGQSGWYFGHLESPIAGEGNVFYNLPRIPELLLKQDVYIIVENGTGSYLYKITEAFVVHQDDLRMDYAYLQGLKADYAKLEPGGANIHLVTCVPKWDYDNRLVVSGTLVGERA